VRKTDEKRRRERQALVYSVRVENPETGVQEVDRGDDPAEEIVCAKLCYRRWGYKTWVVDLRTGLRLWRVERRERAAGGAA
jgi:hypothetical protein